MNIVNQFSSLLSEKLSLCLVVKNFLHLMAEEKIFAFCLLVTAFSVLQILQFLHLDHTEKYSHF